LAIRSGPTAPINHSKDRAGRFRAAMAPPPAACYM